MALPTHSRKRAGRATSRAGFHFSCRRRPLILTPTFFTKEEYDKGWRDAMDTVICDWGLKMAGVKEAHHAYFYAVVAAGDQKRQEYLEEAYQLARDF